MICAERYAGGDLDASVRERAGPGGRLAKNDIANILITERRINH